jgi:hypothetical protein
VCDNFFATFFPEGSPREPVFLYRAAGGFDLRPRALRQCETLYLYSLFQLARKDDLDPFRLRRNQVCLAQRRDIDDVRFRNGQLVQAQLGRARLRARAKADLRQAPLQRHLPAFEADLVIAARTRMLALLPATTGFALPRGMATAEPLAAGLRALCRCQVVETHFQASSTDTR